MKFKLLKLVMKESEELKDESVATRTAAEETLNESDEEIMELVQNSITDGKLPDEIEYKGKTYKQFNVMSGDTTGETSDIYYCNMENTPSGDPQESNDYFFVKVALNKTDNGYKGIKEIRFAEDLTEKAKLTEENVSFEEIIEMMSNAESYEELYSAAENIANVDLKDDVIKFIQQCEDDGDSVEEAYSIVTTDLLDDKTQDLNEDAYITINDGKSEDEDYLIQDVTELEDLEDSDVEAPSIEGLLSLVNESLSNKYGDAWGYMKSKSISMKENLQYAIIDIVTPSILKETAENKSIDRMISKTVILESVPNSKSMVNLKINTLAGTTRFSQKTKDPVKVLTRWLESEYLYDEMVKDFQDKLAARQADLKDSTEAYLKQHPDLKLRIDTIKAQEKMLKDAGMLDDSKEDIARIAYAIAAEFPANVKVKGYKDNEYEMEFDTIDEIVKILFGETYVKEISKEEKDLAKQNKKVLKDSLKENAKADSLIKDYFNHKISSLDELHNKLEKLFDTKKAAVEYLANNEARIKKSLKESATVEELWKYIDSKPNLKYIKALKSNPQEVSDALEIEAKKDKELYKLLHESSLKEGYEAFKIGEIEGVFNPSTGEAMYSIPSKNVTDKKINLEKIQSVETPYDTDTIIKDYIEKNYGTISTVADEPTEDTNPEPIEKSDDIETAEDNVEVNIDDNEELEEDVQSETGSASFYKIRQRENISIDSLLDKASSGANSQESEYIVVKDLDLSDEEMNNLLSNLSKPQTFLQGIEPIDRKNYAFNVVKVKSASSPYTLLIDPVGYDYPRYVSIQQ